MEKTLTIEGKEIRFKATGGTLMRYRNQFNAEFLVDFLALAQSQGNPQLFSTRLLENIIWALAKTADDTIPDPISFYDTFESFDFFGVFEELSPLVAKSFEPTLKKLLAASQAKPPTA